MQQESGLATKTLWQILTCSNKRQLVYLKIHICKKTPEPTVVVRTISLYFTRSLLTAMVNSATKVSDHCVSKLNSIGRSESVWSATWFQRHVLRTSVYILADVALLPHRTKGHPLYTSYTMDPVHTQYNTHTDHTYWTSNKYAWFAVRCVVAVVGVPS